MRILTATLVLLLTTGLAQAQNLTGTYDMSGFGLDGAAYSGTTEISQTGSAYTVVQDGGALTGVGVFVDGVFSVALGDNGGGVYVGQYTLQHNGVLSGTWAVAGDSRVGTETLTPVGGTGGGGGGGK